MSRVSRVFSDLFAYLLDREVDVAIPLDATQRPFVVLDTQPLDELPGLLGVGDRTFEVLPPHVRAQEFEQRRLTSLCPLPSGEMLKVEERWLDLEQEELEATLLENSGLDLANRVPEALRYLVLTLQRFRVAPSAFEIRRLLYESPELFDEAQEPLIVTMERQAHRTFRDLRTRMTRHLKREPRMQHLSRVQEMDAYCLRHLIHQPGRTVAEKAGQRQEIMGIYRQESHDSWENRFVKAFALMLVGEGKRHLATKAQKNLDKVNSFLWSLESLLADAHVRQIQTMAASSVRLNNVLLRRPDYNKVFRAYSAYLARKRQTERLWSYRHRVLADGVYLHAAAALVSLRGALVDPLLPVPEESADYGRFLSQDAQVTVQLAVGRAAYGLTLERAPKSLRQGDLCLRVTREWTDRPVGDASAITSWEVPLWVMWGTPSAETLDHAEAYLKAKDRTGTLVFWTDDLEASASSRGPLMVLPFKYPRGEFEPGQALALSREFAATLFDTLKGGLLDASVARLP